MSTTRTLISLTVDEVVYFFIHTLGLEASLKEQVVDAFQKNFLSGAILNEVVSWEELKQYYLSDIALPPPHLKFLWRKIENSKTSGVHTDFCNDVSHQIIYIYVDMY